MNEFTRMMRLVHRGLNAVIIRRVTGRPMRPVEAYLELYRRYDQPAYRVRPAQLRRVFAREPVLRAKKVTPSCEAANSWLPLPRKARTALRFRVTSYMNEPRRPRQA